MRSLTRRWTTTRPSGYTEHAAAHRSVRSDAAGFPRSPTAWSLVILTAITCLAAPELALARTPATKPEAAEASEPEEPAEPKLVVEGRELLARFEEGDARLAELRREARRTKGEQLQVLNRQIADQRIEILKDISALVDNVVAQQEAEIDSAELSAEVQQLLDRLVPSIVSHIRSAEKIVRRLRKVRETAPETELLDLEQQIAAQIEWGITLYRAYADAVDDMALLGMDAAPEREALEESLTRAAETVARRLEYQMERRSRLQEQVAERPEDEELRLQLTSIEARRERTVRTLEASIRLLERLQLPAAEYQQLLIRTTGEVTADILDTEVALGLVEQWLERAQDWIAESGPNLGFKVVLFVVILALFRLLAWIVRAVLMRMLASQRLDASLLLQNLTSSLVGVLIMTAGALVGLWAVGVELGPVLAGLGIAGFVVGFALQDSLANFAAGVMILGVRAYDVGDTIDAAGAFGTVSDMNLIATTILTFDNQTLVIPNARIWAGPIRNLTHQDERRVDLSFRIAYGDDLDHIERVVREALSADPRILTEPEPLLKVHRLNEWSVDFVVRPWVKTDDYWDVFWDLNRDILHRFQEKGITIPMPRGEVQILGTTDRESG